MMVYERVENVDVGDHVCLCGVWRTCEGRRASDSTAEVQLSFGPVRHWYHRGDRVKIEPADPS